MFKTFIGVLFSGVAGLGQTLAADIPQTTSPPVYREQPPLVPTWAGFYMGLNGGYGFGTLSATATGPGGAATVSEDLKGMLAGGQVGANGQSGNIVFGMEADGQWSDIKNTSSAFGIAFTDKVAWFATLRGRLGLAAGPVLFYGTAGGAYGGFQSSATIGALTFSTTESRMGWTAGGGVEFANGPLSFRAEYLYVQSIPKTTTLGVLSLDNHVAFSVIRGGINYRFSAPEAVSTRY